MRVTATYTVGGAGGGVPANPEMVAVWHNRLWVADGQQGVVVALNPATGQQMGMPVQVPGVIRQLVIQNGATLWGTTANPGTVVRFTTLRSAGLLHQLDERAEGPLGVHEGHRRPPRARAGALRR